MSGDSAVEVSAGRMSPSDGLAEIIDELMISAGDYYPSMLHDARNLVLTVRVAGLDAGLEWRVMDRAAEKSRNSRGRVTSRASVLPNSDGRYGASPRLLADKRPWYEEMHGSLCLAKTPRVSVRP